MTIDEVAQAMRAVGAEEVELDDSGRVRRLRLSAITPHAEPRSEPETAREKLRQRYEREFGHRVSDEMLVRLPGGDAV